VTIFESGEGIKNANALYNLPAKIFSKFSTFILKTNILYALLEKNDTRFKQVRVLSRELRAG